MITDQYSDDALPILVYYNGTFINRQNGAHARMYDQLAWLSRTFSKVILFSFRNHPDCPWGAAEIDKFHAEFPQVQLVLDERSWALNLVTRVKNFFLMYAPGFFQNLINYVASGVSPNYRKLLDAGYQSMMVNYADALTELNGVDPTRCVIEMHDVRFIHYAKKHRLPLFDQAVINKFRKEINLLGLAAGVVTIAPPEQAMLNLLFGDKDIIYIPTYLAQASAGSSAEYDFDLLFVGSNNHFNVVGLIDFIEAHADFLSGVRFAIAGSVCDVEAVRSITRTMKGVSCLGYVDDLNAVYARSKLSVCPVDGTGLKIKAIESILAGRPVLASQHTMAGMPPGYDRCVLPITAEHLKTLTTDQAKLADCVQAARDYAQTIGKSPGVARLQALLTSPRTERQAHS